MSYTIIYDRQVIKTPKGYTFVALEGDNNVYENNRRRARDWSAFFLNKTQEEAEDFFRSWCGGTYQEHFKWHGQWVDDAALMRWCAAGIKNAHTVEEYVEAIHCSLSCQTITYKDGEFNRHVDTEYIRTTNEFLEWTERVQKRIVEKQDGERIYYCISFGSNEPLCMGRATDPNGKIIVKRGRLFLSEHDSNHYTFSCKAEDAIVFENIDKAKAAVAAYPRHMTAIQFVNADNALSNAAKKQYVIAFEYAGSRAYLRKRSRNRWRICYTADAAARFSKSIAKKVLEQGKYMSAIVNPEIIKVGET